MAQKSNRLFNFDLTNNLLTFKPDSNTKLPIKLAGVGKNRTDDLKWIQTQVGIQPLSVTLDKDFVAISYNDTRIRSTKVKKSKYRVAGIDMNPNYIGFTILLIDESNDTQELIESWCFDLSEIKDSCKKNFELIQIAYKIIKLCNYYGVSRLGIEDLSVEAKDHEKGPAFNRVVNQWNRNLLKWNLKKLCSNYGILFCEVNPAYSSTIGNVLHRTLFDPQASAWEIARRAFYMYVKHKCMYPPLIKKECLVSCDDNHNCDVEIDDLGNHKRWKNDPDIPLYSPELVKILTTSGTSWGRIHNQIQKSGLKYRVPLEHMNGCGVFRLNGCLQSRVKVYQYMKPSASLFISNTA